MQTCIDKFLLEVVRLVDNVRPEPALLISIHGDILHAQELVGNELVIAQIPETVWRAVWS